MKFTHFFWLGACALAACQSTQDAARTNTPDTTATESAVATSSKLVEEHRLSRADYADSVNAGLVEEDKFTGSARREARGTVGGTEVVINYGSPGKRGRVLWNGLVSYDQVWVSGSHWATAVTFGQPVRIADTQIPAGTYGFFTIPGRTQWQLILNEHYDQHLAEEYDPARDLVRLTVTPDTLGQVVQRLTYEVAPTTGNQGEIRLNWDQVRVRMPFVAE